MKFHWTKTAALDGFGGEDITLHVQKTGLPFFDALRLYGAIDLYIGLREDVDIHDDRGNEWRVEGRRRPQRLRERDENAFRLVWKNKKPAADVYCRELQNWLRKGGPPFDSRAVDGKGEWDAVLQDGIRGIAAQSYVTLQSGQTSKKECKAAVPLADAVLALAGKKRTGRFGSITFLPIFKGRIDLSKVVSPLRARIGLPNILCAQALTLLALKTALFLEGYHERLSGVAFDTDLGGQRSDNYSGLVSISSTAIEKIDSAPFAADLYEAFRGLVRRAWRRHGKNYQTNDLTPHALATAYWIMQPAAAKHLSAVITSIEFMRRSGLRHILTEPSRVKEVFKMTYGDWKGDHAAVRQMAKAVASAIFSARMNKPEYTFEDKRKAWYDEVTMLRSAPTAKAFVERAMILIEQGHKEYSKIGTQHIGEAFDPKSLFTSIGGDRKSFETFRDLFRMYLVQESTHPIKEAAAVDEAGQATGEGLDTAPDNEEAE